jgi:hypothetical protein
MNKISDFLIQSYIPYIPNYMVTMFIVSLLIAIYTLTKGGLIRHFINYNKRP